MGRWLSVADPSSTAGHYEVEKNCQRATAVGFPSHQPNGLRVRLGIKREDVGVIGVRYSKETTMVTLLISIQKEVLQGYRDININIKCKKQNVENCY